MSCRTRPIHSYCTNEATPLRSALLYARVAALPSVTRRAYVCARNRRECVSRSLLRPTDLPFPAAFRSGLRFAVGTPRTRRRINVLRFDPRDHPLRFHQRASQLRQVSNLRALGISRAYEARIARGYLAAFAGNSNSGTLEMRFFR